MYRPQFLLSTGNMWLKNAKVSLVLLFLFCVIVKYAEAKTLKNFKSDVIVTHWPTPASDIKVDRVDENAPGIVRRQLIKFGEVASRIGTTMGTHATKITSAIDKICEIVKTVIPLLAAVCHVGEFKFCAATTGGPELYDAMNPSSLDLNIPD